MFVRKVTVTENRKKNVYLEIFDHQPSRGKKQSPIARLGPVNHLAGKLDDVVRGMREFCQENFVSKEEISAERVSSWGPVLVARHLWEEMGLRGMITAACGRKAAEAAFALTAERLAYPRREHGMHNWLGKVFIPDETGNRMDTGRSATRSTGPTTRLDGVWDNTLRRLAAKRRAIETRLIDTLGKTPGNREPVVLYQLDSSFVEAMPPRRVFMGWPAEGAQRSIRLHFGAIVRGGWPLTLRFFGSSEPSVAQIKRFMEESQRRLRMGKVLFVAPSGTDEEKLHQLQSLGFHYLVGVRRRRDPRAIEVIQQAGRQWVKIDANTKVQEVLLPVETDASLQAVTPEETPTERYFLVHSEEEAKQERALRKSVVSRAFKALEELKRAVQEGRLKKPATIMARAERILAQRKGYRHISWRITPQGTFEFWQDELKSNVQQAYEGIFLLRTSDLGISPSSAVVVYEGLRRLGNAFKTMHDSAAFRSTPLPLPDLEEHAPNGELGNLFAGHLLVGQLAFLLRCRLETRLVEKKMAMPLDHVVEALETISLAELNVGDEKQTVVSPGNRTAARILGALGIDHLNPAPEARTTASRSSPR